MTIGEALTGVSLLSVLSPSLVQTEIQGLDYDSRRVAPGYLFFAFPGARVDGREFAGQAVAKGAIAVLSELAPPPGVDFPWIQVRHGRQALALAARSFYGKLDRKLCLTG